jgi:murein DD-endopeptidase MepM/ murein hydrolase activator NlpD
MNKAGQAWKRFLVVIYLLVVHALAALFIFKYFVAPYIWNDGNLTTEVRTPTEETPIPTIAPVPSIEPENTNTLENAVDSAVNSNQNSNQTANSNSNQAAPNQNLPPQLSDVLLIPVSGIKKSQLRDTFSDARSDNRVHDAIDIMAPGGTPVVAAANGEIAKFFDSVPGGITIYQYSADKKYMYYYAHLQSRAAGIQEKIYVTQGTVIGYVGDTGNAGTGNFHLHFSIALLKDPKRYWEGEYINPYPLLMQGREAR